MLYKQDCFYFIHIVYYLNHLSILSWRYLAFENMILIVVQHPTMSLLLGICIISSFPTHFPNTL